MASFWAIIDPEAGTNLVCNPSAETTGNYAPYGATVTQSTVQARHGIKAWKVVTGGTSQGLFLFCTTATNTTHYASAYVHGTVNGTLSFTADSGTNKNVASVIGGMAGGWVRYGAQIPPAQTSNSPYLAVLDSANGDTLYIDAVQLEAKIYPTTYIDGDRDGLYRWNGLRHGSSSTRDAMERSGGVERDLDTDYSIRVRPSFSGVGMPPIQNNLQPMALQPGALLQSQKVLPREIVLDFTINSQSSATWATMHQKRQKLINLIKPDRARGAQPFVLRYTGTAGAGGAVTRPLYAKFVYSDGMGFDGIQGYLDEPGVRCVAVDPFWYEDNQETQALTIQQNISNTAFAAARINGQWQAMGTGVTTGGIQCVRIDEKKGRVWVGGGFTTANGVACNKVAYWNGATFVAAGAASLATTGGVVTSLVVMPNSDVWVLGTFTTIGGVVARGLARWNDASDTFTGYNLTTNTYSWASGAVDSLGNVYLAGLFQQWNSVTTQSYVTQYTAAGSWSTVGLTTHYSATEYPYHTNCVAVDKTDRLLVGSFGSGTTGHFRRWNGTTWEDLGGTAVINESVMAVYVGDDNTYYLGGNFIGIGNLSSYHNVAQYNGVTFLPVGSQLNPSTYITDLTGDGCGNILARGYLKLTTSGQFIPAALWNGTTWIRLDLNSLETSNWSMGRYLNDDLYLGWYSESGASSIGGGITSVVPKSTLSTFPKLTIVGPTTSGTTAGLVWLENQASNEKLYFNQSVIGGETLTLDFAPGKKSIVSDWRGTVYGQPLSPSDMAAFHLLPTTNTIALFIDGYATTTSGTAAIMQWTPAHWSADGGA